MFNVACRRILFKITVQYFVLLVRDNRLEKIICELNYNVTFQQLSLVLCRWPLVTHDLNHRVIHVLLCGYFHGHFYEIHLNFSG